MKKLFSLGIFYFTFIYITYSQSVIYNIFIDWKTPISMVNGGQTNQYLYFENAVYSTTNSKVPVYQHITPVSDLSVQSNVTIQLTNAVFQPLTDFENKILDYNQFNEFINPEYQIFLASGIPNLVIKIKPFRKKAGSSVVEKLVSCTCKINYSTKNNLTKSESTILKSNSVLSSGKWVKIKIVKTGVHKISFTKLRELGFLNPQSVRIFGNNFGMLPFYNSESRPDDLLENSVYFDSENLYFYAENQDKWYYNNSEKMFLNRKHLFSGAGYYFITDKNTGFSNRIPNSNNPDSYLRTTDSYTSYQTYENDTVNLMESGRNWYGEHFYYQTSRNFPFEFPGIKPGTLIKSKISVLARSGISSSFAYQSEGFQQTISLFPVCNTEVCEFANEKTTVFSYSATGQENLIVNLQYSKPSGTSEGWLDFITLNARCNLQFTNKQLLFCDPETVLPGNTRFSVTKLPANAQIWDVTNPVSPVNIPFTFLQETSQFTTNTDSLRMFIAFTPELAITPVYLSGSEAVVENQNLHAIEPVDYLIITHPTFVSQATELARAHNEYSNLSVAVVTTNQIYNEFSSGIPDGSAIRDFIRFLYKKSGTTTLKYVLLFGDGSVDNKTISANNTNFIPTYQSLNSLNTNYFLTFVSDDYFGLLDDNEGEYTGLIDVGIGRFPVKNTTEATNLLKKVKEYLQASALGNWRQTVCFIGDDEDSNIHMQQADQLAVFTETSYPQYFVDKIYLDAYPQVSSPIGPSYPDVTTAINNRFNKGASIINYTGHGGMKGLAHERIVLINDINNWSNTGKYPLFITATCEFSRFDSYNRTTNESRTSPGEYALLNPKGGAIALLTTTRIVYSSPNFRLNKNVFAYVLENKIDGAIIRFGDIMRLAKVQTADYNMLNFTLLGDPALQLYFPQYTASTSKINGIQYNLFSDTIKALSEMEIEGEITQNGQIASGFNGIIYPTVLDKKTQISTLNNDGNGIFTFDKMDKILFKGRANVVNGKFKFSFIVPKDINYKTGFGKILYYASDKSDEAGGFTNNVLIGGFSTNAISDTKGPEIDLYLNNKNFVSGGITNENPVIYAVLSDSSGINTSGTGIGHEITATLDNNSNNVFVLNDAYVADIDNFRQGELEYALNRLEPGKHTLKLKAWDVFNNSSEKIIEFQVSTSDKLIINKLYNYPNPFTSQTGFYFEHNQSGAVFTYEIAVLTMSGRIVKLVSGTIIAGGFREGPIYWNGLDDFGGKIAKGVYIYRLKIRNEKGETAEKYEKLLYLK